jgi:predicted molibdopterin-dependent oxidoreductase YjgC
MRLAIGTNKIDSSARYGQINAVQALRRVQGRHRWTVGFEDIVAADTLVLLGTNITETNPVTGLRVKEAVKKHGATLLTIEALVPAMGTISNIVNLAAHHVAIHPAGYRASVLALVKTVVEDKLPDSALVGRAPAFVAALQQALSAVSWPAIETMTGTPRQAWGELARTLCQSRRAVVIIGQGVLRAPDGYATAMNLLDLLLLTGHHGRPGCGLAPLAEENNDQGAVEMGTVAEYLPGPSETADRTARERVAGLWKEELPQSPGRRLMEILEEARMGVIKALYVVGENPVASLPPSARAKEALEQVDFLVCQEVFPTETTALADVVLPACSYAEKSGTFTNTEGYVQQVRQAIDPLGESRPDWEIVSVLAGLMHYPLDYADAKEILKEIRILIPGFDLLGGAPARPDAGAVERYLQEGYAQDLSERYTSAGNGQWAMGGGQKGTVTLVLGQSLFHSGKFSTHAKGLLQVQSEGKLGLSPADAARLAVQAEDRVTLRNDLGEAVVGVQVLDRLPEGLAVFPEHFDHDVRRLFPVTVDARTGVPYWKQTQVIIERREAGGERRSRVDD